MAWILAGCPRCRARGFSGDLHADDEGDWRCLQCGRTLNVCRACRAGILSRHLDCPACRRAASSPLRALDTARRWICSRPGHGRLLIVIACSACPYRWPMSPEPELRAHAHPAPEAVERSHWACSRCKEDQARSFFHHATSTQCKLCEADHDRARWARQHPVRSIVPLVITGGVVGVN